jgi:uroporphyrinogen-III synthase
VTSPFHKVVCTRRLDDYWKEQALQRGIILECFDFLEIRLKDPSSFLRIIEENSAPFVFTSAHSVRALAGLLATHPDILKTRDCFCIEGTTSASAAQAGFRVLGSAEDAQRLAPLIIQSGCKRVLHCSSLNRRQELGAALAAAGIQADFCAVYEKALAPQPVAEAEAVLFYSPSQTDAFLKANKLNKTTPAFCIGATTAGHLKALGHEHIHIAPKPATGALLETVFEHFKQR